jgi:hypothetical protein
MPCALAADGPILDAALGPSKGDSMEYGDVIVYLTIAALGASVLVIVGLLALLIYKAYQSPPS